MTFVYHGDKKELEFQKKMVMNTSHFLKEYGVDIALLYIPAGMIVRIVGRGVPLLLRYMRIRKMVKVNYSYPKAKAMFKRESMTNPKLSKPIRSWLKQEYKRTGSFYKVRNPRGMHVGHRLRNLNHPKNFRWEYAIDNLTRGGKWERLSDIRTVERFFRNFPKNLCREIIPKPITLTSSIVPYIVRDLPSMSDTQIVTFQNFLGHEMQQNPDFRSRFYNSITDMIRRCSQSDSIIQTTNREIQDLIDWNSELLSEIDKTIPNPIETKHLQKKYPIHYFDSNSSSPNYSTDIKYPEIEYFQIYAPHFQCSGGGGGDSSWNFSCLLPLLIFLF